MHSPPRLTGCSGLPSTLMARPSRAPTSVPHPLGHSPHTLAYQVTIPGMTSSGGTTRGMIFSGGIGEQAEIAAAGPALPRTLRNVRRSTTSVSDVLASPTSDVLINFCGTCRYRCSVMTGQAVTVRAAFFVAIQAPAHAEGFDLYCRLH